MRTERSADLRVWIRLATAAVIGAAAGLLAPVPQSENLAAHLLLGFIGFGLFFSVPLLWVVMRIDAPMTKSFINGLDPTRSATDVIVVLASIASLGGVGFMLLGTGGGNKNFEAITTIATVAIGWLIVHTTYTLRYARHWYNAEPGCIEFDGEDNPRFSDFAYVSFTLGMTYQVSDTGLKTNEIRKIVLRHTLLSYLFGTVIVAATINLVAGLAK